MVRTEDGRYHAKAMREQRVHGRRAGRGQRASLSASARPSRCAQSFRITCCRPSLTSAALPRLPTSRTAEVYRVLQSSGDADPAAREHDCVREPDGPYSRTLRAQADDLFEGLDVVIARVVEEHLWGGDRTSLQSHGRVRQARAGLATGTFAQC